MYKRTFQQLLHDIINGHTQNDGKMVVVKSLHTMNEEKNKERARGREERNARREEIIRVNSLRSQFYGHI